MALFRQKALDKLRSPEQLDEIMVVTSPQGWLVLGTVLALIVAALVWSAVASIEMSVRGQGALVSGPSESELSSVLYVSLFDAYQIEPGMTVHVAPANVRKEEFGLLQGEVIAVSTEPAPYERMLQVTGSDSVAQMLLADGLLAEVEIRLLADDETPTGYAWTSARGPDQQLVAGIFSTGNIIVSAEKPIDLVLTNFSRLFGGES